MSVFILRRLMQSVLLIAVMTVIVFAGVYAIGNPIDILISADASQEEYDRAVRALGLDRPLWEQYFVFLGNLLQGDLGKSFVFNEPALSLVFARLPATLELAFAAMLLSITVGIPLGMWAVCGPTALPAGRSWPARSSASPCRISGRD
jgi:peptide/nickel transport system permease protein